MKRLIAAILLIMSLSCCDSPGDASIVSPPISDTTGSNTESTTDDIPDNTTDSTTDNATDNQFGRVVVGYATYWDSRMPDPTLLTHINYAFAKINDDFESLNIKAESRLKQIAGLKNTAPELKVLLSIGGWGASNFSEMAADDTHRKNFCINCLEVVEKYNLDGIDLDWEYPTSSSAGISSSLDDTRNFNYLVKELRAVLGENRLLTMASSANAKYVDFKTAVKYLDFVNIMTYDMGKPPYHNAGLYASSMTKRSCDESVRLHVAAGVPYDKLVLGIPFYGHGNEVEFPEDIDYNDVCIEGYVECWDEEAKVPYLVNSFGEMILTYDDEISVGIKADYVISKGLCGAMYWSVGDDDDAWSLSKAISNRLLAD